MHFCVARGPALRLDENEAIEFAGFAEAVGAVERSHDFVVVDTAGADNYLTRLAHSMADTLITPLNDSFVDLDVIGIIDASTYAVVGESHYAAMVREARRQRRAIDGTRMIGWWCATGCPCWGRATNDSWARACRNCQRVWAFAARRVSPNAWSTESFFPRTDRAGQSRSGHPGNAAQPRACDGPGRGDESGRGAAAPARRARQTTRGSARRMVRRAGKSTRCARPCPGIAPRAVPAESQP